MALNRTFIFTPLVIILACSSAPQLAGAITYSRTTGPGLFRQGSLWGPYFPPGYFGPGDSDDSVQFNLGTAHANAYTVSNVQGENSRLLVGNDTLTLDIQQYTLTNNSANDTSITMGLADNDIADVDFTGTAASQLQSSSMQLAAVANSAASISVHNIQWHSAGLAKIGYLGSGTLKILDGAQVTHNGQLWTGYFTGSYGQINVVGSDSSFTVNSEAIIGDVGVGALRVAEGAQMTSINGVLGNFANSHGSATVTGAGSTWTNPGQLAVGLHGVGTLSIDAGANVSNTQSAVGVYPGGTGTVTVQYPGSVWTTTDTLSIGGDSSSGETQGHGKVFVYQDGKAVVGSTTTIYAGGALNLQGGSFLTSTMAFQGGAFNWTGGALSVGVYNGNLTNGSGVLVPGDVLGSTTIAGNYTQLTGGKLAIDLGGTAAGVTYDSVGVTGSAILGGQLQLNLANGFVPGGTDTFSVFNAVGGVLGVFSNVGSGQRLRLADGVGSFLVNYGLTSSYNPNQVVLSNFRFGGDFNNDGVVNAADYSVWRNNLGAANESALMGNGDGLNGVDEGDYMLWKANFGNTSLASGAAGLAAVPEPTSGILLVIGALLAGGATRRRRTS
jgi:T5SS/PEP-CTERM-associated repeat protein